MRRVRCLLAIAVFWASGWATAAAGQPLRIVTFNAEFLAAPSTPVRMERYRWSAARQEHLEKVASLIETLEPDILNLVEVVNGPTVEALVKILHAKGLVEYEGHHVESADNFTGLDVALITKIKPDLIDGKPIRHIYSYAGDPTWRESFVAAGNDGVVRQRETSIARNALYFITVGRHKLGFLGLHLKSDPADEFSNAQRAAEAKVAQRIIRQEIVRRGYTPIVLGDLNDYDPDVPDRDDTRSTKTQVLANLKRYDPDDPQAELFNVAARIVRKSDRYTSHWDRNENGAVDPYDVMTMIDHILLHKSLVPSIRRVFISHVHGPRVSDHWPVVVDLVLP